VARGKITPGDWRLDQPLAAADYMTELLFGGYHLLDAGDGYDDVGNGKRGWSLTGVIPEPDARLIAEAGTVANECGLWPRELLEQRNELLAACEKLVRASLCSERLDGRVYFDRAQIDDAVDSAAAAIARAKGAGHG
jgi:hypothetical protein